MNPMNDRTQPRPAGSPAQRRRFRIAKLEERIAPKKGGYGTKNTCGFCSLSGRC